MAGASRDRKDTLTIRKWGHSLGLRIPAGMAREAGIQEGSDVTLHMAEGRIVVTPEPFHVPDLATLVKRTRRANRPALDDDAPVGKEML